jgi:hypothetical protein
MLGLTFAAFSALIVTPVLYSIFLRVAVLSDGPTVKESSRKFNVRAEPIAHDEKIAGPRRWCGTVHHQGFCGCQ